MRPKGNVKNLFNSQIIDQTVIVPDIERSLFELVISLIIFMIILIEKNIIGIAIGDRFAGLVGVIPIKSRGPLTGKLPNNT
jgi:hypothetical protein